MRVLAIGDTHEPFCHPMYRRFCEDVREKWKCNRVVLIGDVVDGHRLSRHEPVAESLGAEAEAEASQKAIEKWYASFPKAKVCIGNHDARHFRKAASVGIPSRYLVEYATLWKTPGWDWRLHHTIDDVDYLHGMGAAGKDGAINMALNRRKSCVIGHLHVWPGVKWHANDSSIIYGVQCGCGLDTDSYAAHYSRDFPVKPVLSCAVIIDGKSPYVIPMQCGVGEKYHRSKAGRKPR